MKTSSSSRPHLLLASIRQSNGGKCFFFLISICVDSSSPHIPAMETLPHLQTWPCRGRDRCSKWYLGHGRPSLAPCEGETDVNELLSWWLVEQHSPKLPHLSPSSSSEPGIQTVAGGSGLLRDFLEAGESFVMMTQMPPLFCPPPPTPPNPPQASVWALKYPHVPATLLITV